MDNRRVYDELSGRRFQNRYKLLGFRKSRAHAAIDPIRKKRRDLRLKAMERGTTMRNPRTIVYERLAEHLKIPPDKCHMSLLSLPQLLEVISFAKKRKKKMRRDKPF